VGFSTVHWDRVFNRFHQPEFTQRCTTALERVGDEASNVDEREEAVAAYSTALSLGPIVPNTIIFKWANMVLKRRSVHEASSAANKVRSRDGSEMDSDFLSVQFNVPRFVVYRVICDILERDGRLTHAVECFQQMQNELPQDAGVRDERAEWELGE